MNILFSDRATRDYENLSENIKQTADKQFDFLINNLRHPSLHAKKYEEDRDVWQGRISKGLRFYFQIRGDAYYIITIIKHV